MFTAIGRNMGGKRFEEKHSLLHLIGVKWCNILDSIMTVKKVKGINRMKRMTESRASVSFPPELYRTLEKLAQQKKVSLAWVVREAAEKYVQDQWPLFKEQE